MKLTKLKVVAASAVGALAIALISPFTALSTADAADNRTNITPISGKTMQVFNVIPTEGGIDLRTGYHDIALDDQAIKGGTLGLDKARIVFNSDMDFSSEHDLGIDEVPETFGYFTDGNFWPGISAQSLNEADLPNTTIHITKVTGPGKAYVWNAEDESAVLNNNAFQLADNTQISFAKDRTATEWFFTRAGDYQVTAYVERTGKNPATSQPTTLELRVIQNAKDTVSEAHNNAPDAPSEDAEDAEEGNENPETGGTDANSGGSTHQNYGVTKLYNGHIDAFYVNTNSDGSLNLQIKEDITGRAVLRPANSAILMMGRDWFTDKLKWKNLPADIKAGYVSPNSSARNMLYPGWASSDYKKHGYSDMSLKFVNITAPENGKVAIFHTNIENDAVSELKDGSLVLKNGSEVELTPLGHTHFTWLFTQPGKYQMSVQVVGKKKGQPIETKPVTYTWYAKASADDEPEISDLVGTDNEMANQDEIAEGDTETPINSDTKPEGTDQETDTPSVDKNVTLDHGHVDLFNVSAKDGKLILNAKEDVTGLGVLRPAEKLTLRVQESTMLDVPKEYHDKLAPRGYFLAQSGDKQKEVLFPGWDTMSVSPEFGQIDINLVDVQGPGKVYLFQNMDLGGGIGPVLKSGSYVMSGGETIHQAFPAHTHANWLFEKPGTYTMKVQAQGVPVAGGQAVSSPIATYTWVVGNAPLDEGESAVKPGTDGQSPKKPRTDGKSPEQPNTTDNREKILNSDAVKTNTTENTKETTTGNTEEAGDNSNQGNVNEASQTATSSGLAKTGISGILLSFLLSLTLLYAGVATLIYKRVGTRK